MSRSCPAHHVWTQWLVLAVACSHNGSGPARRSEATRPAESVQESARERTEPAVESPSEAPLRGRIVDAHGEPRASARVRVFARSVTDHGIAHGDLAVRAETRTNHLGQFSVQTPQANHFDGYLVVDLDGMARTIALTRDRGPVEVRLEPGRIVSIEVRCRQVFEELDGAPGVDVFWHWPGRAPPFDYLWSTRVIPPEGTLAPEPALPGYDYALRPPEPGVRRFAMVATLPPGRSTVTVSAPCGFATRDVEVSEGHAALSPIQFTLPQPDAGVLEVFYTGFQSTIPFREPHVVFVWNDGFLSRRVNLSPAESVISRAIPAGAYLLGAPIDPVCQRRVEIRSGAVTRVDVHQGSCMVSVLNY